MTVTAPPLLSVDRVSKRFPGVQALREVSLAVHRGEVLAVIGENGAGKSTLMKILAGVQRPDSGEIRINGQPVVIDSVVSALNRGVALIHQELNLADNLDVGANISLGREPRWLTGLINHRKVREDAEAVLQRVGLPVSPRTLVRNLSVGQQQMVEIAKALSINARVLIMDEPTSSLSQHETEALFQVVKELRTRGVGIVYISHRLGEVKELADRVVVLRDGENAGELARNEIHHDRMVQLMVGRDVSQFYTRTPHQAAGVALEVEDLVTSAHPSHSLRFALRRGEIVGIAGLVGAGRTEVLRVLFGIDPGRGGTIKVDGRPVRVRNPRDAIAAGIALVPEDRKQQGLILEMAVRHNVGLAGVFKNRWAGMLLNRSRERTDAAEMIVRLGIRTPSDRQIAQVLSGGNQQKVVLGKWLTMHPRVLLLDEPTRGIDIGAKQEIYGLMDELARSGTAVLFASSEMEEILGMSDRVLVMHEGRLAGELPKEKLSEEAIMQLATGK